MSIKEFEAHLEEHLGPIVEVIHDFSLNVEAPYLTLYIVKEEEEGGLSYMVTHGLSTTPITLESEDGIKEVKAEYVLAFSPLIDPPIKHTDPYGWLLGLLGYLVRAYALSLKPPPGSTAPITPRPILPGHYLSGEDNEPLAPDSPFHAMFISHAPYTEPNFGKLGLSDGSEIEFWGVFPLFKDELAVRKAEGARWILDRIVETQTPMVLSPTRPSLLE